MLFPRLALLLIAHRAAPLSAPSAAPREPAGRLPSLDRTKLARTGGDAAFYARPRLVTHADDAFLAELTALYARVLPADGAVVLDLMGSHVSHLPENEDGGRGGESARPPSRFARVDVHGLNADELALNPARSGAAFVHDLNAAPALPFAADAEYDAVLCCCGVQYLEQPEQVFAEARRGPDGALARALSFLPTARS